MEESFESRAGRYLSNEMTGSEREAFELEISTVPALKEQYLALQRLWEQIPSTSEEWDTQGAWDRLVSSSEKTEEEKFSIKRPTLYWAIAATIFVVLGTYAIFFSSGTPVTYVYEKGSDNIIELKDGSKIYLNQDADITVFPFTRSRRHLVLHGEAFFEVSPDAKRPFTISTGKTLTEVVGTSFNIQQSLNRTTIFVSSGKVIFSSKEDTKIAVALAKGEAAVYENSRMERIANPSPNVDAWRTGQLRFSNMPLTDVIRDISDFYRAEIIIENPDIKSCRITRTLPKQAEINSVLNSIALTMNAKVTLEGEKFIIQGGSCQ